MSTKPDMPSVSVLKPLIRTIHYTIYILIFAFTFSASGIKIKAPKSKEKLKIGNNYQIKWKSNKRIKQYDKVKIFISFNSGNKWELIAITENDGLYNWEVPSKNSKNCLIKIQNLDNSESSISKKEFIIDGPEINILYPSQGVFFAGGDKAKIIWNSKNLGNELINIFYSTDNGYTWNNLATNSVDVGLYIWDVPHLDQLYEECFIKISSNSNKATRISSQFTIINQSNKIRIKQPNGGELIESGEPITIKWEANGLKANLFKILFSKNSGNTWERVESRVLNTDEYLWITPDIESEDCLIKIISVENKDIYDISEQSFKISKNPTLKISNPLENQFYYSNTGLTIEWNTVNVRGKKVNIYYSIDKGKKWNVIERGVLNNGKFKWDISEFDTTSTFSKIKIELSNNIRINDINKGYFTIYGKPKINLLSQSNLMIEDKSIYRINWVSKNIRENRINIYYSINNGKNWRPIEIDLLNKGFYDWTIPSLKIVECIFKIESVVQPDVASVSEYPINITDKSLIIIKNILNNLELSLSDSIQMNWESYNLSDQYIDILYSEDSGTNWKYLHKNIINTGSKKIQAPFVSKTSKKCKIKIVDSNNKDTYSISSGFFKIERPKGTIDLLSSKEKVYDYDDIMKIVWNDEYLYDKVGKIYYSVDNGKSWRFINQINISEGYLDWEIPNLEFGSNECIIKISIDDANYNFIDNLNFFQINPAPFINIINNKDTVKTNMPFEIKIASKNIDNLSYSLDYSLTRGVNWTEIKSNIKSSKYLWNVPSIKGYKNILLKIELNDDHNINDMVKMSVLEQCSNILILEPNGNENYIASNQIPIIWSIKKIYDKTIDIYYSLDGGLNWNELELGARNSGKYTWSIINKDLNSKECKIKVQSNLDNNIFDVSDGLFSIKSISESFNIITPNDGDILHKGTSTFIYWDNIDKKIDSVDISYSLDKGHNWFLIKNNLDNVGKYNWAVPKDISSSNNCLVKITASKNNELVDYSDNTFTIK